MCCDVCLDDTEGRCVPCDAECLRCTDLSSICTECIDGYELFSHNCIVPCATRQFRATDGRSVSQGSVPKKGSLGTPSLSAESPRRGE